MSLDDFVFDFAKELEDIDPSEVTSETCFKDLPEWDSLTAITVMSMIKLNYDVDLSGLEINNCDTIAEVYSLVEKANG